MRRLFPTIAVLLAAAVVLGGCGKAGKPLAPADSKYPKTYPQQAAPAAAKQKEGRALPPEWDQEDLDQAKRQGQIYVDPSVLQQRLNQPATGAVGGGVSVAPDYSPLPPVISTSPQQVPQ